MQEQPPAEPSLIAGIIPVEEIARVLTLSPIFGQFDRASLLAAAEQCRVATFGAGAEIMRQGEPGGFAYLILDGEADVFAETPAGLIEMSTLGQHKTIGELGAFTDMRRTATVKARTDLKLLRIDRENLMSIARREPSVAVAIIGELGQRLHSMNTPLAYLTYAARALARDEYDDAILTELIGQQGELANFARDFAEMAIEIRAKQHRHQEMLAAADIQRSILPAPLPREGAARAVDLYAEMRPAREIGGDFYDFRILDERWLSVTVADVSGKGIPAALFMAVSRTVMRGVADHTDMASQMIRANRLLAAENDACMFVTMFYGLLDLATGSLCYCNAGHNPPYLLRAAGGRERLQATGIPFGIEPDRDYPIGQTVLHADDALLLFSDGITDACSPDGEAYGNARLESALEEVRERSATEIVTHILADNDRFVADAEKFDDITCLALRYRPEQPRNSARGFIASAKSAVLAEPPAAGPANEDVPMEIATEHLESIVLIRIKGRCYSSDAQAVEDGLAAALGGAPHLAVDMTELDYISSAGLRVLLKLANQTHREKGKMVLFGLRPNVREVFSISAFDRIFSIYNDRAAAVAAIG
jgi:sigma-B regulation protein RsbU (phosphoserine phosphatase)